MTTRFSIGSALILLNISIFVFAVLLMLQSWKYRQLRPIQYLVIFLLSFCFISFSTLNVYISSSLDDKMFFSRLRYIGFAILAPAGLLFFSSVLKRWNWLHKPWVWFLLFGPGVGTILISLGVFDPTLQVRDFNIFEHWGVSVVTFDNGPWFWVHYRWNNLVNLMVIALLIQALVLDRQRRWPIFLLSTGAIIGSIIDAYCVATNSPFRWLMVSAGTFGITEVCIWYVSYKYDLLGVLSAEKAERAKLRESVEFQRNALALLAHDLSGNIHQQAQLAQVLRKKLQDNHNEVLNIWSDSAQASSDLIGNVMRWIRTQSDEFKPQIMAVEIHDLLVKCIRNVEAAFGNRQLKIQIDAPPAPYFVNCDPEMVSSIVRNLLSNAIKASEDGQSIWIRITPQDSRVGFAVQDQGKGMSEDKIKALGSNQNVKRSAGAGYGIGLTLASHFVHLHSGRLEVKSEPHKGTEVYFSIPL